MGKHTRPCKEARRKRYYQDQTQHDGYARDHLRIDPACINPIAWEKFEFI